MHEKRDAENLSRINVYYQSFLLKRKSMAIAKNKLLNWSWALP